MGEKIERRITAARHKARITTIRSWSGCLEDLSRKVPFGRMARVTGLEPAASGVTGRRSNQLSYTRVVRPGNYDAGAVLSRPNLHFFSRRMNFL